MSLVLHEIWRPRSARAQSWRAVRQGTLMLRWVSPDKLDRLALFNLPLGPGNYACVEKVGPAPRTVLPFHVGVPPTFGEAERFE